MGNASVINDGRKAEGQGLPHVMQGQFGQLGHFNVFYFYHP